MALTQDKPIQIEPFPTQHEITRFLAIISAIYKREEDVTVDEQAPIQAKNIAYNRQASLSHVAQLISEIKNG